MKVMEVYQPLWMTDKSKIMLKSGRIAGKSYGAGQFAMVRFIDEDGDIVVFRDSASDNKGSIYNEIVQILEEEGLHSVYETKQKPLKIINKFNGNKIHFMGIGGADEHRTKGFKPDKDLSLILGEELQQVSKQTNLDQAIATFIRFLKPNGKILYLFNPDRRASQWTNEYYRVREYDDSWLTMHTSYKDISQVLNQHTLNEIETERITNPSHYRHMYLGETEGLFGAVYSSFDRDRYLVDEDTIKYYIKKVGVLYVLIGVDPATTRDKTAFIPIVVLNNGQTFVLNYFYHDPEKNGVITNDRLMPYVNEWMDELYARWGFRYKQRADFIFDTQGADLLNVASYRFDREYNKSHFAVHSYSQKNIIEMAQILQNAFSRNVLYILDEGGIYDYIQKRFIRNFNPLITQLETVIWNEAGDGFDKTIDNDATDALTYGIAFYFKNPENMYFPIHEGNKVIYYEPLEKTIDKMKKKEGEG
jgi:PBSX family phage terminase large subunit